MARRDRNLKVEVPKPEQDRAEFGKVGLIAAFGFAIGVAWPWLTGVHLAPSPPTDDTDLTPAASASSSAAASAAPAVAPPEPGASALPARTDHETVKVGEGQIVGCRDGGKKLKNCDKIQLDKLARPKLDLLAACEAGKGKSQILSIGFELDFEKSAIGDVFAGKSTTFQKDDTAALVDCAKKAFEGVTLAGLDHEHPQYTVFYFVEFIPPGATVEAPAPEEQTAEASGLATVQWDVAVVRDAPEDGKIVARLRYGTRAVVTARRGKWYEVRYDAKGAKGWVHANALGL